MANNDGDGQGQREGHKGQGNGAGKETAKPATETLKGYTCSVGPSKAANEFAQTTACLINHIRMTTDEAGKMAKALEAESYEVLIKPTMMKTQSEEAKDADEG